MTCLDRGRSRPSAGSPVGRPCKSGAWFALLACLWAACGQSAEERQREKAKQAAELKKLEAAKPPSRRGPVGVLTGQVQLAAGARLPRYAPVDLSRRPLQLREAERVPEGCAAANEAARAPVQQTSEGLLSGIVVAASDFTRMRERAPKVHKVAIEDCRLKPVTIAATGGDTLELVNRDDYPFQPLIGPTYEAHALPQGKKLVLPMVPGGIDSLLCSLGASCGRTDMIVFFHTVHAVTDATGTFKIANFPAAENVRVTAWHPLFEESETFVWLDPGQRSHVKLILKPKARFVPDAGQGASANGP